MERGTGGAFLKLRRVIVAARYVGTRTVVRCGAREPVDGGRRDVMHVVVCQRDGHRCGARVPRPG